MFSLYIRTLLIVTPVIAIAGASPQSINLFYSKYHNTAEIEYPHRWLSDVAPDTRIPALRLAKLMAASKAQWVRASIDRYRYTGSQWSFSARDTFLYNSDGRNICHKTTSANTGWNIANITYQDSTIWDGSRVIEDIQVKYVNGVISDTGGYRNTYQYSADFKKCVHTSFNRRSNSWKMFTLDTLLCRSPITEFSTSSNGYYREFLSNHRYMFSDVYGKMAMYHMETKSETESNDSLHVIIIESNSDFRHTSLN
jgi:hypothetical protein